MINKISIRIVLTLLISFAATAQAQWFVDTDNSSGIEDGLSWQTSFTTIQPAMNAAGVDGGGEVWVADGAYSEERTYIIDGGNTGALHVPANVTLLGGFTGIEGTRDDRDFLVNVCIIDGSNSLAGGPAERVVIVAPNGIIDGFEIRRDISPTEITPEIEVAVHGPEPGFTIRNLTVRGTSSNETVTAIAGQGGLIEGCEVTGNFGRSGTAIGLLDCVMRNCVVRDNEVSGAFARGSTMVEHCTFERNRHPGGLPNEFGGVMLLDDSTVVDCTFIDNEGEDAGAILARDAFRTTEPAIRNCQFINNRSTGIGGAINIDDADTSVDGCVFIGNSADEQGGAIAFFESVGTITNSVFYNNSAQGGGGAIYVRGNRLLGGELSSTVPTIINSTFYGNTSNTTGQAIFATGSDLRITNSIFWNNCPDALVAGVDSTYFVYNTLVEGGLPPLGFASPFDPVSEGIIDAPPQFVDAANGNFMLSASSPAINAGLDTVPEAQDGPFTGFNTPITTADLDGVARPQSTAWDLGAYEFVPGETGPGMDEESLCPAEGEGEPEGMTEGSSEGSTEGNGEGATEGSTEGMNEGTGEGMPEGTTEGGNEGANEGSSEGGSEGNSEGVTEGSSEGNTEGDTEGNGDTHGGCPWNNDGAFTPPTDAARGNAGTILVLALTSFVLLRTGRRRGYVVPVYG